MTVYSNLPLGVRLAGAVSIALTLVMGGVMVREYRVQERAERTLRSQLLKKSLSPLAYRISKESDAAGVARAASEFHRAYIEAGYGGHRLQIENADGRVLWVDRGSGGPAPPVDSVEVSVSVRGAAFLKGDGRITVWESAAASAKLAGLHRKASMAHFVLTLGSVVSVILLLVYLLVTRPLNRLMLDLKRMEMGYWGEVAIPEGAREIRWLAGRFQKLGLELRKNVERLVAAERRASAAFREERLAPVKSDSVESAGEPGVAVIPRPSMDFEDTLRKLEQGKSDDLEVNALASRIWERGGAELELLDDWRLKTRIEDAALRILNPEEYQKLEDQIRKFAFSLEDWTATKKAELTAAFERDDIPVLEIQQRVKNIAGVWKKMRAKNLLFNQVHDLIALRVIVPTESDCYAAFGVVHAHFEPEFGRFNDYIADPKKNGYQSIHTCVRSADGRVFEVQIRSASMHRIAETGAAAHWIYKSTADGFEE